MTAGRLTQALGHMIYRTAATFALAVIASAVAFALTTVASVTYDYNMLNRPLQLGLFAILLAVPIFAGVVQYHAVRGVAASPTSLWASVVGTAFFAPVIGVICLLLFVQ